MKSRILQGRLANEYRTMGHMAQIYCRANCHGQRNPQGLCDQCQALLDYAETKLDRCPYGDSKPTCGKCPIHCYKPEPRQQARIMMRYAGPRMLLRHPLEALQHLRDNRRPVPAKPPMRANRRRRQRTPDSPSKAE
ncbi:nitrous oxide-stimulated promoter family protein [Ferrimonas kyonanensis]|uniref:nitrous oxide-stimulated promoter family protein n=1 Tax=Ferrimonas kyonanensis TaxID=364763 RepID=UPI0003F92674|nr:nitrous oxide-stimulated promoter family protein [Ferrimonas kyonanensis]